MNGIHPVTTTLKRGRARRIVLERWEEEGRARGVVVKHFESPNPLHVLRDRARAHAEFWALTRLAEQGLPVPRAHAIRRVGRGWQVEMDWVRGSRDLAALLASDAPWPADRATCAERLGRLFASMHAAGIEHTDLHAGNVLLDGEGRPVLIDLHGAAVGVRWTRERLRRQLIAAAATERERTSARFRALFFTAWHRALPAELRDLLEPPARLARDVEGRARFEHRANVLRNLDRWTRASSRVRVARTAGGRVAARLDLDDELVERCARLAQEPPPPHGEELYSIGAAGPDGPELFLLRGPGGRVIRRRWLAAARLQEHGVPALLPYVLALDQRRWAVFAAEPGTRPLIGDETDAGSEAPPELALALGELAGRLHDRGLALPDPEVAHRLLWREPSGRIALAPPEALAHVDPRPAALEPEKRLALMTRIAGRTADGWRAASAGYLGQFRLDAWERRAIRADLRAVRPNS